MAVERLYLRLVRINRRELSLNDDMLDLALVLGGAPEVSGVELMGTHSKGGHVVYVDLLTPGAMETLGLYLEGCGWRCAM